ncbi:endonuclease domain-containing protein, partial [Sphingorhabdus buctiana]
MKRPKFRGRDINRSRELRREASLAERLIWPALSSGKLSGHRFTRQYQIGPYFCDLVCRSAKLVVEIDGFSHDLRQGYDARRDSFLRDQGYRVLRFANDDVMHNLEGVVATIAL